MKRRNKLAHQGEQVGQAEAAQSVAVAREAIRHVTTVAERLGLSLNDQ